VTWLVVIEVKTQAEAERVRERAMTEARHMEIWPEASRVEPKSPPKQPRRKLVK
jgi:hypothetical protein